MFIGKFSLFEPKFLLLKKYVLEITVFVSGAVVMMLELTGSRIMAPFLGTSTFIWTSLIGIILASLSAGYYYGGKYADAHPSPERLGKILVAAGVAIGVVALINQTILGVVQQYVSNLRLAAVVAASLLFGVPGFLLGMVSPMSARLRMTDVSTAGSTIGGLYALSSVGSIFGTFLVGFYLLGVIGSLNTLYLLAGIMLSLSMLYFVSRDAMLFLGLIIVAPFIVSYTQPKSAGTQLDTEYNAVTILDLDSFYNEIRPIRLMRLGNEYSSAMYMNTDSLTFRYTRYYELAVHFNPQLSKTLLIGGAGYSVPKFYQRYYPQVAMDVVEIDQGLTQLAMEYFQFKPSSTVKAIHADGRIFLNSNKTKYEAIFIDAYKSLYSIPFHLVSVEAWQKVAESLEDDGFVQANVLASVEGAHNELLTSIIKTARQSFPVVKIFKVSPDRPLDVVQNVMLVCFKSEPSYAANSSNPLLQKYLDTELDMSKLDYSSAIILTDDFAPVEHFGEKMIAAYAH